MIVRMLVSVAGGADSAYDLPEFSFSPGDTPELHDDLAAAWIDSGRAEPMPVGKKKSTAAVSE
jgi:hypothetical protein